MLDLILHSFPTFFLVVFFCFILFLCTSIFRAAKMLRLINGTEKSRQIVILAFFKRKVFVASEML